MNELAEKLQLELDTFTAILNGPRDEDGNLVDTDSANTILVRIRDLASGASALALDLERRVERLEAQCSQEPHT